MASYQYIYYWIQDVYVCLIASICVFWAQTPQLRVSCVHTDIFCDDAVVWTYLACILDSWLVYVTMLNPLCAKVVNSNLTFKKYLMNFFTYCTMCILQIKYHLLKTHTKIWQKFLRCDRLIGIYKNPRLCCCFIKHVWKAVEAESSKSAVLKIAKSLTR